MEDCSEEEDAPHQNYQIHHQPARQGTQEGIQLVPGKFDKNEEDDQGPEKDPFEAAERHRTEIQRSVVERLVLEPWSRSGMWAKGALSTTPYRWWLELVCSRRWILSKGW